MRPPVIMLVAAEPSGDVLGADLMAALRRRLPEARFIGLGEKAEDFQPFDPGRFVAELL